ncbi:MAG: hypothetical protein FD166_1085 [Bacteroidetes bacterium]|nr:MAG: hypothetical protein FD166_1085 [Bacteroidota bacterium]
MLSILVLTGRIAYTQWPVYGTVYEWAYPSEIKEIYDNGFILAFDFQQYDGSASNSALLKVDVNGDLLWEKVMQNESRYLRIEGLTTTSNGGIVISGRTRLIDQTPDPFIMKLNSCMQVEWCNIYSTPGCYDNSGDIVYLKEEDSYITFFYNSDQPVHERTQIIKLDSSGNQIWCNNYMTNPGYIGESPMGLVLSEPDSSVLLNGFVYAPEDSSGWNVIQPYFLKVKQNGDFIWEFFNVPDTSFTYGLARKNPVVLSDGTIAAPAASIPQRTSRLIGLGSDGEFQWINTIHQPDSIISVTINSSDLLNSKIYLGTQNWITGFDALGYASVVKNDSLGNFIGEAILPVDFTSIIYDICATSDDKLMILATHDMNTVDFMLIKYNENMDYDSICTQNLTYDSLCPEGITSGTIEMGCDIITDISKQGEEHRIPELTIAPNPAVEYTIVYLPETIATNTRQGIFDVTSHRSDYVRNLTMQVYDIYGRQVISEPWPDMVKEKVINTSDLKAGIYLISIQKNDKSISSGKLMIR